MFSVSFREGLVVLAILAAFVLGATVKHWRDVHREKPAPVRSGFVSAP